MIFDPSLYLLNEINKETQMSNIVVTTITQFLIILSNCPIFYIIFLTILKLAQAFTIISILTKSKKRFCRLERSKEVFFYIFLFGKLRQIYQQINVKYHVTVLITNLQNKQDLFNTFYFSSIFLWIFNLRFILVKYFSLYVQLAGECSR